MLSTNFKYFGDALLYFVSQETFMCVFMLNYGFFATLRLILSFKLMLIMYKKHKCIIACTYVHTFYITILESDTELHP